MDFNNKSSQFSFTVVGHLLMLNIIIWLATIVLQRTSGIDLYNTFAMYYWRSARFHFFQPLTYMFMHDTISISHIFCNMFALFMFGRDFEQIWGGKKFLIFYFVAGFGAAIIQQLTWELSFQSMANSLTASQLAYVANSMATVGASGAIFGLLLAFGWMFPEQSIFIMFIPIPIKARWFVAIYAAIELFAGIRGFRFDNIAHFAHLGGMLFALFLLLYWKKRGNLYNDRLK
ncbi:MAG: rhomboid family intramembrane serine protease [Bacteroidales bacterium]|nr:rhomboid family intramembrane serine protease [Bacteroidales bacterium]